MKQNTAQEGPTGPGRGLGWLARTAQRVWARLPGRALCRLQVLAPVVREATDQCSFSPSLMSEHSLG